MSFAEQPDAHYSCCRAWEQRWEERWDAKIPIPLVMYCPAGHQHIDEGEWATKPHKTHRCTFFIDEYAVHRYPTVIRQRPCGLEWRPGDFPTVGVRGNK